MTVAGAVPNSAMRSANSPRRSSAVGSEILPAADAMPADGRSGGRRTQSRNRSPPAAGPAERGPSAEPGKEFAPIAAQRFGQPDHGAQRQVGIRAHATTTTTTRRAGRCPTHVEPRSAGAVGSTKPSRPALGTLGRCVAGLATPDGSARTYSEIFLQLERVTLPGRSPLLVLVAQRSSRRRAHRASATNSEFSISDSAIPRLLRSSCTPMARRSSWVSIQTLSSACCPRT